jgi:hypothetical protein
VVANRTSADARQTRPLIREQAALMRLIQTSCRELQTTRRLNPSANPPLSPPRAHRQEQSTRDSAPAAPEIPKEPQPDENAQQSAPAAADRSQPAAKPKTFAPGGGFSPDLEPV